MVLLPPECFIWSCGVGWYCEKASFVFLIFNTRISIMMVSDVSLSFISTNIQENDWTHFGSVRSGNHNSSCRVRHRDYHQKGLSLLSCSTPSELKAMKANDATLGGAQNQLTYSQEAFLTKST